MLGVFEKSEEGEGWDWGLESLEKIGLRINDCKGILWKKDEVMACQHSCHF
jgi:hypothetical protein